MVILVKMDSDQIYADYRYLTFNCRFYCYQNQPTTWYYRFLSRLKWPLICVIVILFYSLNKHYSGDNVIIDMAKKRCLMKVPYLNRIVENRTDLKAVLGHYKAQEDELLLHYEDFIQKKYTTHSYYKYGLANSTRTIVMDCGTNASYYWFMKNLGQFQNLGLTETLVHKKDDPICSLNLSSLGPITVSKQPRKLNVMEKELTHVKPGGYSCPSHCRPRHRVAILITYRHREKNLGILLHYLHTILPKQLLEYRIFVIEQSGKDKFNKGALYNVGFLESQRFGTWQCYIFHDVDLIPQDERILYSCPRKPTHLSSSVESQNYQLPYLQLFGGVTALTMNQFETVNGYSNLYLNWGAEDDDMYKRIQAKRYPILRYNSSIARFITLPHVRNSEGLYRYFTIKMTKKIFRREGLNTLRYRLIDMTKRSLYTHFLVDVDPFGLNITSSKTWQKYVYSFLIPQVKQRRKF